MLIYADTKREVGKLPVRVGKNNDMLLLRYTYPSRARPSGELILKSTISGELMRAAPPVYGLNVVQP